MKCRTVTLLMAIFFSINVPVSAGDSCYTPTSAITAVSTSGSVLVGTVIIWPFSTNPEGWSEGKWLECNGQSVSASAYPELRALGYTVVPNLRERVPWGSSTPGQYRSAGLPNITGGLGSQSGNGVTGGPWRLSGCFTTTTMYERSFVNNDYGMTYDVAFDASQSSSVYGSSSTVQPPAYTVRYLIRAKN